MGVINCSPESFYSGSYAAAPDVYDRAARMHEQGADLLDIGARSTAPAAPPLSVAEEITRIDAALTELDGTGFPVSVDTVHPEVLEVCLRHEIHGINDIRGLADADFARLAAESGLPVVAMASVTRPGDAVGFDATLQALRAVQERCVRYGIENYILDPGVGRWTPERSSEDDWEICRRFDEFQALDRPLLAAISRKTFIGDLLGRPAQGRLAGTLAATLMLIERGAAAVRCHDVQETADLLKVYEEMVKA